MKKLFVVMINLTVLISSAIIANAYDWYEYNGHQYTLTNDWETWASAEQEALALGGHLVTINTDAENDWLTWTFKDTYVRSYPGNSGQNIAWIGYYNDNGYWKWISGEPVTYYRHDYSQWPQGGNFAYLHLAYHPYSETWNANPLHNDYYDFNPKGIIEVVPEPLSALLLLSGGIPLAILRRKKKV
ncbi:MAG: PEP-CTERM sorting domain-containing protein [Candidatus Schekmanbacteria bacterium]|nr:PEP-CTERM sorting domain-containing protein [Candidatus Schekmanbacteria bacterium]